MHCFSIPLLSPLVFAWALVGKVPDSPALVAGRLALPTSRFTLALVAFLALGGPLTLGNPVGLRLERLASVSPLGGPLTLGNPIGLRRRHLQAHN